MTGHDRVAWFHCFNGVAGDMAFGALVDAGADLSDVRSLLDRLPLGDWDLETEPVLRAGIAGTKVHVLQRENTVVRTAAHIQGLIDEARLPDRVARRAHQVFRVLAEAEGRLHRRSPDQVHFHEVGGVDAIVDVVGVCAALEVLDVGSVVCSPVSVGLGMVRAAHGIIPNPSPAVVELLAGVPTRGVDLNVELTTPTGAALMVGLADRFGALPTLTVASSGFGAGTRDLDHRPNLTQVVVGTAAAGREAGQPVMLVEANLDDATGEVLAHAVAALLDAGAHDAWITPIVMKKGRPAHTVSALTDVALLDQVADVLVSETGTLGVRATGLERWPERRTEQQVDVDGRPMRVKVSPGRVKAESDDAAAIARATGRPIREVLARGEAAWHEEPPAEPVPDDGSDATVRSLSDHAHQHHPSQARPDRSEPSDRPDDHGSPA